MTSPSLPLFRLLAPGLAALAALFASSAHASGEGAFSRLTQSGGEATVVATLLAAADRAAQARGQGRARLEEALATLDRMGAHPLDPAADPLPGWRGHAESTSGEPVLRGRTLGPAYRNGRLPAGGSVRLPQLFDGGRTARVAVATPGRAPLEFSVVDEEERPVCPPTRGTTRECSWVPLYSGRFEIVVSNSGPSEAGYYLVID